MSVPKVWVVVFDTRPVEVWAGTTPVREILHRDIGAKYIQDADLLIEYGPNEEEVAFDVPKWCKGELIEVYGG